MLSKLRIKLLERSGLNYYVTGDYTAAETCFKKILEIDNGYRGIRHNLGVMALAQERFAEAEKIFLSELELEGEKYPHLRLLAEVYYLWGKREKALATYSRANAADPPRHEKRLILERIAVCKNNERFKQAVLARQHYAEGNRLMDALEWKKAEEQYVQAVKLDISNVSAWNNLGSLRMNQKKDYAGAAEAFRAALSLQRVAWIANNLKNAERLLVKDRIYPHQS